MKTSNSIRYNLLRSILLGSLGFGIMSFLLPIYSKRLGGNAYVIGGLFSVFSIITMILRPLVGKLIDRYGRRRFFLMSFVFYSMAMISFSYSTSLWLLYISRMIQAIGSSFMWISAYTIAVDISDNGNRGRAVGQVDGASAKGAFYGAVLGYILLSYMPLTFQKGWGVLFKIYALFTIIAGFIAYKYMPETINIEVDEKIKGKAVYGTDFFKLMIIVFITAISTSMLSPLIMIYLQDKFTTNIAVLATAFIPATLVYAYLPSKLGGVSDKIGRIIPMAVGLIGSGIVSFFFTRISDIKLLVILWVVESIGIVMASPAEEALVADVVGENVRGTGYGIYLFVSSLGAAIGPLIGGFLYDKINHSVPFYLNGIILFFNAFLTIFLFKNYIAGNNLLNNKVLQRGD